MKIVLLLYSIVTFAGMLWTGYHPLALVVSFWAALALFYALECWKHYLRIRRYRRIFSYSAEPEERP